MADNNTIARPYAQAAFEVAQENNAVSDLSESLAAAALLFEDGQLAEFLSRPSLNDEQRLKSILKRSRQHLKTKSMPSSRRQRSWTRIKLTRLQQR